MYVLGINELYHDCSAALVEDGRLVAVVEEERLDRIKHTPGLCWGGDAPRRSVDWCLAELGITDAQVAAVALSYDMTGWLAVKTIADALVANARRMRLHDILQQRIRAGDHAASVLWGNLGGYFGRRRRYLRELRRRFGKVFHVPHHRAHAASAFRPSGFEAANILVVDGLGEDHATSLFHGRGERIEGPFETWSQYQSLGMLYKTVTFLLGLGYFGDGKTMGLSAYGRVRPAWSDLLTLTDTGYRIHLERIRRFSPHARRSPQDPLTDDQKDIAATVQDLLERACVALARNLHRRTGERRLCMAGGVGLNCNANAVLRAQDFVDELFVQPGSMDMGTAMGAALEVASKLGCHTRHPLDHVYYGPRFSHDHCARALAQAGLEGRRLPPGERAERAAALLAEGKVLGWYQDRLEFGPRALGNRSILARPDDPALRDRVNRIKDRELWRPLAPAVLEEAVGDWFEAPGPSPFMTLTFRFRPEVRARVPGVVHVDGTARIQTVRREQNPLYYDLIRAFERRTGLPMLVNTSFNRRWEPIVCTPEEAVATFLGTDIDALQLGPWLVEHRAPRAQEPPGGGPP